MDCVNNLSCCVAIKLLPLFDRYEEISLKLLAQGFDDILYYDRFLDSFAKTEDDLQLSKMVRVECACRDFWNDCLLSARGAGLSVLSTPAPFDGNWFDLQRDDFRKSLRDKGEMDRAKSISIRDVDPCYIRQSEWMDLCYENWRYFNVEIAEKMLRFRDGKSALFGVEIADVIDDPVTVRCPVPDD